LLAERGLKLDGVIELKVDEGILIRRIEKRVADMTARGEKVRADDTPEVLKGRLAAYRVQTAPLADYYADKRLLKTVDGMALIDEVTAAIGRVLRPVRTPRGRSSRRKAKSTRTAKRTVRKGSPRRKRPAATKRKNKSGQRKKRTRRS